MHFDFSATGISSVDYGDGFSGRPHGGLCFLWRRSLYPFIEIWFTTMRKDFSVLKLLLLMPQFLFLMFIYHIYFVYLPNDNYDEYQAILGKIQAISDSFESSNSFIIGDFNADLIKTSLF